MRIVFEGVTEADVIYTKIGKIKHRLTIIEKVKSQEIDPEFRLMLFEFHLQRAIQACIDMAHVVIAKEGLSLPNNYRQAFEILSKEGIITNPSLNVMKSMVGFRNISIHDYQTVMPAIVLDIVAKHLSDFKVFYAQIYKRAQGWKS